MPDWTFSWTRRAAAVATLVVAAAGCTAPTPTVPPPQSPATLTPPPAELGDCAPDRLTRCIPGLADIEPNLFNLVSVGQSEPGFTAVPPSAAREAAPKDCQNLPRFGANDTPELDVNYRPATDADGKPFDARFPANGEYFHVRFMVAGNGDEITTGMNTWAHQCPMWGIAPTLNDNGIQGWMIAESADKLRKYEAGDIDAQWPYITHTAATVLPSGVIVQALYRTTDPSATSRNHTLSAILGAAGRPRLRSALPPTLADWSEAQISTLLPPLAIDVTVDAQASQPGGRWSLCPEADHGPTPLYDTQASWTDTAPPNGDPPGHALTPTVRISRARAGVDYLTDLRREIATCTAHLTDKPALCADRDGRQSLHTDSAVADGEDTVRITQRWMRVEKLQGYDRCVEGIDALRVAQVRGLIVITSTDDSSAKGEIGDPSLRLSTLDELLARTVQTIKAA